MRDKSISRGKEDLIPVDALCKERMGMLCVFRYRIHFPGLFKMVQTNSSVTEPILSQYRVDLRVEQYRISRVYCVLSTGTVYGPAVPSFVIHSQRRAIICRDKNLPRWKEVKLAFQVLTAAIMKMAVFFVACYL
jgi:hypothetical protein